jgi:hypothetical protein
MYNPNIQNAVPFTLFLIAFFNPVPHHSYFRNAEAVKLIKIIIRNLWQAPFYMPSFCCGQSTSIEIPTAGIVFLLDEQVVHLMR